MIQEVLRRRTGPPPHHFRNEVLRLDIVVETGVEAAPIGPRPDEEPRRGQLFRQRCLHRRQIGVGHEPLSERSLQHADDQLLDRVTGNLGSRQVVGISADVPHRVDRRHGLFGVARFQSPIRIHLEQTGDGAAVPHFGKLRRDVFRRLRHLEPADGISEQLPTLGDGVRDRCQVVGQLRRHFGPESRLRRSLLQLVLKPLPFLRQQPIRSEGHERPVVGVGHRSTIGFLSSSSRQPGSRSSSSATAAARIDRHRSRCQ